MAIKFFPIPDTVLMCDYGSGGFVPPEMVKRRRVVVVSPRFEKGHSRIALVVPISTTAPRIERAVHVRIESGKYPFLHETDPTWVKADMLSHVGFARLDRIWVGGGSARGSETVLQADDFKRVQAAVIHALGMGELLTKATISE